MMGKLKINARNVMADIQKLGDKWKGIRIVVNISVKDRYAVYYFLLLTSARKHTLSVENSAGSLIL